MKKTIYLTLFLLAGLFTGAQAQQSEIYAPNGKAINGYDPVAFFKASKPVMGADSLSYKWKDATWYFSTKANLDSFKMAPEKYAPQYGGYCAYGCSEGHQSPTQIDTWTIMDNKLYFNYNKQVQEIWKKDAAKRIEKANMKYPEKKK